jgi:uncharacterized repeat protein (TIGR01451 family)
VLRKLLFWAGVFCAVPSAVEAAGTAAGTVIQNTATLTYSIGGTPATATTPPASFTVAELINVTLVSQDAANVAVNSPDSNRALTFVLTNTGNGPETFAVSRNNAVAGDNFDPINGSAGAIFLENGLQAGFQASGPNADTLYVAGSNDPALAADASRVVYVVSNVPAALVTGNIGRVELTAAANTAGAAGAAPGTTLPGLGQGGVDAVVGGTRAQARQTGGYVVSGVAVVLAKSVVSVIDVAGGTGLRSGSIVTYRIVLAVTGSGIAQSLELNDPLPANTTYVVNSITVNGQARTDAADADQAEFSTGTVKVRFGDTAAPINHTIEFRVVIN